MFWTNFVQKGCSWSKTKAVNAFTEFCIFELVLVTNFYLSWQFLFFGSNLSLERYFRLKTGKVNTITIEYAYSN